MITIWNQREVYIGYPSQKLKTIIYLLKANKIKFKCRVFSDSSAHTFSLKISPLEMFGKFSDSSKIYYVYVHKKDFENALEVLRND